MKVLTAIAQIFKDLRFYFFLGYWLIALIMFLNIKVEILDHAVLLDKIDHCHKAYWCVCFASFGFGALVFKLCLNEIDAPKTEIEKAKIILRYLVYYPVMLTVLSLVAYVISNQLFANSKNTFFATSALISFFVGYFVDSLPVLIEKIGSKISK